MAIKFSGWHSGWPVVSLNEGIIIPTSATATWHSTQTCLDYVKLPDAFSTRSKAENSASVSARQLNEVYNLEVNQTKLWKQHILHSGIFYMSAFKSSWGSCESWCFRKIRNQTWVAESLNESMVDIWTVTEEAEQARWIKERCAGPSMPLQGFGFLAG